MNDMKDFNSNLPKKDKISYKNIDIFYIGYIPMKHSHCANIDSLNSLYLIIDKVDVCIEEKTGENIYFWFLPIKTKKY